MAAFGEVLRYERHSSKRTLDELATAIGCSASLISRVESGKRKFPANQLYSILDSITDCLELNDAERRRLRACYILTYGSRQDKSALFESGEVIEHVLAADNVTISLYSVEDLDPEWKDKILNEIQGIVNYYEFLARKRTS